MIKKAILLSALLIGNQVFGQEKMEIKEVISYAAQKYRVDYNTQSDKIKQDILEEYKNNLKLVSVIDKDVKNMLDLKISTNIIKVELWAKKYMQEHNPTEAELKKLYIEQKPKIETSYKLRHILLKDEVIADKFLEQLNAEKNDEKKLLKFTELAKNESIDFTTKEKGGEIGFVDQRKLDVKVQDILKDKKKEDIVKIIMPNNSVQLVYIEDIEIPKDATFEESKEALTAYYKQKALNDEIEKILKKGK